jgi:hypothetical protein
MTEELKPLQVYPADDMATLQNKVTKLVVYAEQVEHQRDSCVTGAKVLKRQLEASEKVRVALVEVREVLMELAPFVAVFARNPVVSPETRELLLKVEPRMLAVLLATKVT